MKNKGKLQLQRLNDVNRVEVIDQFGRCLVAYNIGSVEIELQDSDRTLKVFMKRNVINH